MFGIFMLLTLFGQLIQQIRPHFVAQRALYEVCEGSSKTYSWKTIIISNIFVELPWNSLMSVLMFLCWYYPVGLYNNAEPTYAVNLRAMQMWLVLWKFLIFSSTFAHLMIAAENAGNLGNLLRPLFRGFPATPEQLPRFWIFMYRVSPFTYLVSGMLSAGISNMNVICADNEYLHCDPVNGACGDRMQLLPDQGEETNVFLSGVSSSYSDIWRIFGIMGVFIIANIYAACLLYWWVRGPKSATKTE
ncbi:hypothetical protein EMCG_09652 [[Emmonsia] crescens]|uniref:ABC-2 type transporter transmembrane domain-containing protein n=1 Tax=[Emmonsia] crescens TaxID=73230 RepID=A0A0G2J9Q0_9EURO|nr:hypothetical protein EMCG_09652 [Emmonsia crescens UAMH 3008]